METIANTNLLGNYQTNICNLDVSISIPNSPSSPLMLRLRTRTPQPQEAVTQFTARNNKGIIPLIDPITLSTNTQVNTPAMLVMEVTPTMDESIDLFTKILVHGTWTKLGSTTAGFTDPIQNAGTLKSIEVPPVVTFMQTSVVQDTTNDSRGQVPKVTNDSQTL